MLHEQAAISARGPGAKAPTYQQVIANDEMPAPVIFHDIARDDVPVDAVPRSRYTDPAFAAQEREAMWSRVWYLAARVEDVPEPGDFIVYDGPLTSVLVTRDDSGSLHAFHNSCPHRGMRLCDSEGAVGKITCPFHAFRWNLDGTLDHVPSRWDFPQIKGDDLPLKRIRLSVWQGFVFVCHDDAAPPLETYLGRLVTDFENWNFGGRYAAKRLRKIMHANWKACIETFIEAYHLVGIHPQALPFGGDTSAQYDVWADEPHMSRMLQPLAVPSDQEARSLSEQEILAAAIGVIMGPEAPVPELPEGQTARQFLAAMLRQDPATPPISDSELLDAMQYSIFPNIVFFRSTFYPYTYRFTPDRNDPGRTVFDFYIFEPLPADGSPPPTEQIILSAQETYADSGAFPPWLGMIYDQDSSGLANLQRGLSDGGDGDILFARYQEKRIRQLHQVLNSYLQSGT